MPKPNNTPNLSALETALARLVLHVGELASAHREGAEPCDLDAMIDLAAIDAQDALGLVERSRAARA